MTTLEQFEEACRRFGCPYWAADDLATFKASADAFRALPPMAIELGMDQAIGIFNRIVEERISHTLAPITTAEHGDGMNFARIRPHLSEAIDQALTVQLVRVPALTAKAAAPSERRGWQHAVHGERLRRGGSIVNFATSCTPNRSSARCRLRSVWIPSFLFDFQQSLLTGDVKTATPYSPTAGAMKTPLQPVGRKRHPPHERSRLILTPLAVSIRRSPRRSSTSKRIARWLANSHGINVTNYERLHHFNPDGFAGVVCDESSILKSSTARGGWKLLPCARSNIRMLATAAPE
jgi:hypothetical protein